jgi:hypothetical protein
MNPIFSNLTWSLDLPPPWRIEQGDNCFEITQPEGAGVMQIRHARKEAGAVSDPEILAHIQRATPKGTACVKVRCRDFTGYVADYVDWATSRFWRVWFVACGGDRLHIIYTCWKGEEELEAGDASGLLQSLRSRA